MNTTRKRFIASLIGALCAPFLPKAPVVGTENMDWETWENMWKDKMFIIAYPPPILDSDGRTYIINWRMPRYYFKDGSWVPRPSSDAS